MPGCCQVGPPLLTDRQRAPPAAPWYRQRGAGRRGLRDRREDGDTQATRGDQPDRAAPRDAPSRLECSAGTTPCGCGPSRSGAPKATVSCTPPVEEACGSVAHTGRSSSDRFSVIASRPSLRRARTSRGTGGAQGNGPLGAQDDAGSGLGSGGLGAGGSGAGGRVAATATQHVKGTLTAVSGTSITVRTAAGASSTYPVTSQTEVLKDGTRSTVTGDTVSVHVGGRG